MHCRNNDVAMNLKPENIMTSKWLPVAVFGVLHILITSLLFTGNLYNNDYSAAGLFYDYASLVFQGQIPFRDFYFEYPPLALLFFLLPRLSGPDFAAFSTGFIIEILLFDLIAVVVMAAASCRLHLSVWKTLTIYTLSLLAIGPIIINRYDIIPAALVLLALCAWIAGKNKTGWAMLALATMTKVYPIVIAPIIVIDLLCRRRYREIITGLVIFASVCAVTMLPFIVLSPENFLYFWGYHVGRDLQIESIYSSFLMLGQITGITAMNLNFSSGSWNVVSPQADIAASVSPFICVLSLLAAYWLFYRYRRQNASSGNGPVVQYSLAAVALFVITSKVFSPQFIIWLYPLVPLITGKDRTFSWALFLVIGVLTYLIFPVYYQNLLAFDPPAIFIVIIRNVLLLALAVLWLFYQEAPAPKPHKRHV
jgi:uncharacterized membrane protein